MKILKTILKLVVVMIVIKVVFALLSQYNSHRVIAATSAPASAPAAAAEPAPGVDDAPRAGYHRYLAGYGVSVSLPESWSLLSQGQVQQIAASGSAASGYADSSKVTSLAANSSPDAATNDATLRVSFSDRLLSDEDLRSASAEDVRDVCSTIYSNLSASLNKLGTRFVVQPVCSIGTLAQRRVFITDYQRSDVSGPDRWRVRIFQLPLNQRLAMITVSYKTSSASAQRQIADVIDGLSVR